MTQLVVFLIPVFSFLAFVFTSPVPGSQKDCELRKSQDSIFVYACKVADSNLKSIRADFTINARPSVLAGHMLNVPDYIHWQYRMVDAEILKRVSDNEVIYHSEVGAPWPVSNRDLVVRLRIVQDPKTKVMTFTITSIPDFIPEKKGVVRVPRADGKWIVTPDGNNKLKVSYSFQVDPGGSIPAWLLNLSIAEGPYQTFHNLNQRIEKGIQVTPARLILD